MQLATPVGADQNLPLEKSGRCRQQVDHATPAAEKDHFVVRDGLVFAGTHLLLDLWDAKYLDDIERVEQALRDIVEACRATLLHIHLLRFSPSGGISGVAVLAESHISVHTWPERDYAAFDVFMCGNAQPENAVPVLQCVFQPKRLEIKEELRGVLSR